VHWIRRSCSPKTTPSVSTSLVLQTRHTDQKDVTTGQKGDQSFLDHPVYADNDPPDGIPRLSKGMAYLFDFCDDSIWISYILSGFHTF